MISGHRIPQSFPVDSVLNALQTAAIPCKRKGGEIEADLHGTGHLSCKINPRKGVFFTTDGQAGTLSPLLRQLGIADCKPVSVSSVSPRVATGTQDTSRAARRLWQGGWLCTHQADMPSNWDRGLASMAKGARRAAIERQRDAALAYYARRFGPDFVVWAIRQVRLAEPSPEYKALGAVVMVLSPMHSAAGDLCGVQRLHLLADGSKAEADGFPARKMLGRMGTCRILPPAGRPKAPEVPSVLVGEGWETVASGVLASGALGEAAYTAANLGAWSRNLADNQKLRGKDVSIGVLVDRDLSQTGQKASAAAVRILRSVGHDAVYLLPPESVLGGSKGADWSDVLVTMGVECTAVALGLAAAGGSAALDLVPADSVEVGFCQNQNIRRIWPVRTAEMPQQKTATLTLEQGRARLDAALQYFLTKAQDWSQGQRGGVWSTPPTVGLEITTGVGKSRAIRRLIATLKKAGIPVVIVANNRSACAEYEMAGAFWRHGREDLTVSGGFQSGQPHHCPKVYQAVEELASKKHMLAGELCGSGHCEHGNQRSLIRAIAAGKAPSDYILDFFRDRPELKNVAPCTWLDHHKEAMGHLVITVTGDGLGTGDMDYLIGSGADQERVPRIVIMDESAAWTSTIRAGVPQFTQWLHSLESLADALRQAASGVGKFGNLQKSEIAEKLALIEFASPIYRELAAKLGQYASTKGQFIDVAVAGILQDLLSDPKGTQLWEKSEWRNWTELEIVPLRAAREILKALRTGTLAAIDGCILVHYLHPAIEESLGTRPLLVADATLSHDPVGKAAILGADGEILRLVVEQPAVIVDPRFFHGAVPHQANNREARLQDEVQRMLSTRDDLAEEDGQDSVSVVISQKPVAMRALATTTGLPLQELQQMDRQALWDLSIAEGIGWWGWHDRAHDAWNGRNLVIWDQPAVPRGVWQERYEAYRVYRIDQGAAPDTLPHLALPDKTDPEYSSHWQSGCWVATGDFEQESKAAQHGNSQIRAFIQDHLDAARMQAIGRVRGVSNPNVKVRICGGTPIAAFAKHGVTIGYKVVVASRSRAEKALQHDAEAASAMTEATLTLVRDGKSVTRDGIMEQIRAAGTYGKIVRPTTVEGLNPSGANTPGPSPRKNTVENWLRKMAPALCNHLSTTGQNAKFVRELRGLAQTVGIKSVTEVQKWMQLAEEQWIYCGCDAATMVAWSLAEISIDPQCPARIIVGAAVADSFFVKGPPPP